MTAICFELLHHYNVILLCSIQASLSVSWNLIDHVQFETVCAATTSSLSIKLVAFPFSVTNELSNYHSASILLQGLLLMSNGLWLLSLNLSKPSDSPFGGRTVTIHLLTCRHAKRGFDHSLATISSCCSLAKSPFRFLGSQHARSRPNILAFAFLSCHS